MGYRILLSIIITAALIINFPEFSSAQSAADSFYLLTKSNAWKVTKYLYVNNQVERTIVFDKLVFKFNQTDSSRFIVEENHGSNMRGKWSKINNDLILISVIPFQDPSRNSGNTNVEVSRLLSWPLKNIELTSDVLKFRVLDTLHGEAIIEFSKQ